MTNLGHPHADDDGIVRDGDIRGAFFKLRCENVSLDIVAREMHAAYNKKFFGGLLYSIDIVVANCNETHGRFFYGDCSPRIQISEDMFEAYEWLRDTLLHEMCHQYVRCHLNNHTEAAHGQLWEIKATECGVRLPDQPPR